MRFKYMVLLAILAIGLLSNSIYAQTFSSIQHEVSASFVGNDPYGEDFPSGSDSITSSLFSQFINALDIGGGGASTECSLFSDLDRTNGVFYAYGYSASDLYVQGFAQAKSKSSFQTEFRLRSPGQITLSGAVGVAQFLGDYQTRDVPGKAQISVSVRNLNTNRVIAEKVISMDGYIASPSGLIQVYLEDELPQIALRAGRYRLLIQATSSDDAVGEEVAGSIAVGFFEVEGMIREN